MSADRMLPLGRPSEERPETCFGARQGSGPTALRSSQAAHVDAGAPGTLRTGETERDAGWMMCSARVVGSGSGVVPRNWMIAGKKQTSGRDRLRSHFLNVHAVVRPRVSAHRGSGLAAGMATPQQVEATPQFHKQCQEQ